MNIAPIDPSLLAATAASAPIQGNETVTSFSAWLDHQLQLTNNALVSADDAVRRMAVGEPVSLHQVMVQLERAKLQFELVQQVRNKLMDAYQDLLRMQI